MLLALTLAVAASPPAAPVALEWQAPAACPDAATVTAMTLDLLRDRPPDTTRPPLLARAAVTHTDGRFQVALELRAPEGDLRRSLGAQDCQLLARGVALLIAVHFDPLAVTRIFGGPALIAPLVPPTLPPDPDPATPPPAPAPAPAPTPAPPPIPAPSIRASELADLPPRPDREPVPATSFGGHLRLEGGVDVGTFNIGGDAMLVGGVGGARWRVDLGVVGSAGHRATFIGANGRFTRLGGLVRGCAIWRVPPRRDRLALLGCLGLELDGVRATAPNVARPETRWTPWGAALVGAAARVALVGPVGLWLGVEAEVAFARHIYSVGSADDSFASGRAGVRANLGVDLQFVARKRRPATTK